MSEIKTKQYTGRWHPSRIVFIIHGGCFTKGDENYDKKLCEEIIRHNSNQIVVTMDFRQDCNENALIDILSIYSGYSICYPDVEKCAIGISSGGFYAMQLGHIWDKLVLLCPVADPYVRYNEVSDKKIRESQLEHFKTIEAMKKLSDSVYPFKYNAFVLVGDSDRNIPPPVISRLSGNTCVEIKTYKGGHELTYKINDDIVDDIMRYFRK